MSKKSVIQTHAQANLVHIDTRVLTVVVLRSQ